MRNRILPMINFLLVLVCAGCVWFLSTRQYEKPKEIVEAEALLKSRSETTDIGSRETEYISPVTPFPGSPGGKGPRGPKPPAGTDTLKEGMFKPIWTPTPTPTPSPTPTPAPPDLTSTMAYWTISSIDGNTVEFTDKRTPDDAFKLTVNGPGKDTVDKDNKPLQVKLISVDQDAAKATLGYGSQVFNLSMFP